MITNNKELQEYLSADARSMKININSLKEHFLNPRWRFIKRLRKAELYSNSKGIINRLLYIYHYSAYKKLGMKLGYSIPINVIEAGLSLPHYGTLVISKDARIGKNARIHICVNIGATEEGAPQIGENVYIGPGAKLFGNIKIGNNVKIGANAVVNKSFEENDIVLAGIPAKIVRRLKD